MIQIKKSTVLQHKNKQTTESTNIVKVGRTKVGLQATETNDLLVYGAITAVAITGIFLFANGHKLLGASVVVLPIAYVTIAWTGIIAAAK